jgi:hypothetical protein
MQGKSAKYSGADWSAGRDVIFGYIPDRAHQKRRGGVQWEDHRRKGYVRVRKDDVPHPQSDTLRHSQEGVTRIEESRVMTIREEVNFHAVWFDRRLRGLRLSCGPGF